MSNPNPLAASAPSQAGEPRPGESQSSGEPRVDHRRLGRELGIFTGDELAGAGFPLWLPDGATIVSELERYIVEVESQAGYHHVRTPPVGKRELYEGPATGSTSPPTCSRPCRSAGRGRTTRAGGRDELVLRPVLCPHHALVYRSRLRSHRELPLRIGEVGQMFRMERSGVVGGLTRVRGITLNDGHRLLSARPGRRRGGGGAPPDRRGVRLLGIRPAYHRLSPARRSPGRPSRTPGRADVAARRRRCSARRSPGTVSRSEMAVGRSCVLRTKDRRAGLRRPGARVHPVDRAGRPVPARAVRPRVRRAGRQPAAPGDGAPEHARVDGADGRLPARGLRRRASAVAVSSAGAGRSVERRRSPPRLPGSPRSLDGRACGSRSTIATRASARGSGWRSCARRLTSRSSGLGRPPPEPSRSACATEAGPGRSPPRTSWRECGPRSSRGWPRPSWWIMPERRRRRYRGRAPRGAAHGATRWLRSNAAWLIGMSLAHAASIFSATISISRCGNDGNAESSRLVRSDRKFISDRAFTVT